ncbi:MAG: ABC-2 family transporter protein [Verrucomicrobia bacterium]|nr:ABC-2 family transporter protein [Verrucomicrobiota bacterium]
MDVVRKYVKVFDVGLQNNVIYRWNFLLRAIFELCPLIGTIFVWRSVFESRGKGIGDYNYASIVFYFVLVLVLGTLISPQDDEWQVAADIRDGQINSFVIKPANYLAYRFTLFLSSRVLYTVATLPILILVLLISHAYIALPSGLAAWLVSLYSVVMAGVLQFLIAYSVALLAFWMLEISTVRFIVYSFEYFFSGHFFPLSFLSPQIRAVVNWTPFPYEMYFPITIIMGNVHGRELIKGLTIQTGWVMLAAFGAIFLWRKGLGHYEAVGG